MLGGESEAFLFSRRGSVRDSVLSVRSYVPTKREGLVSWTQLIAKQVYDQPIVDEIVRLVVTDYTKRERVL